MTKSKAAGTSTEQRVLWVDALKGVAIILVVAQHAADFLFAIGWESRPLDYGLAALSSIRMPAFFFASALFFGPNFSKPWGYLALNKIAPMLYLYAVWVLIRAAFLSVGPWPLDPQLTAPEFLARSTYDPQSSMWFIFALAIYFAVSRATANIPLGAGWIIAVVPSTLAMTGMLSTGSWAWDSILKAYFFFYAGAKLSHSARWVADKANVWIITALWLAWAALTLAAYTLEGRLTGPLLPVISASGLMATIATLGRVCRVRAPTLLARTGKRTLPIYLLHVYFLALATAAVAGITPNAGAVVVAHVAFTLIALFGSLLVWRFTRRAPGLYAAPWTERREARRGR